MLLTHALALSANQFHHHVCVFRLTHCRLEQRNAPISTNRKASLTPEGRLATLACTTTQRHRTHIDVDPHIFCAGQTRTIFMKPQYPRRRSEISREILTDKTNDRVMNPERGALVRDSDPFKWHSVHTKAGDMWRAPGSRMR